MHPTPQFFLLKRIYLLFEIVLRKFFLDLVKSSIFCAVTISKIAPKRPHFPFSRGECLPLISDLNSERVSAHLMFTEVCSATKLCPPFSRSMGTSNVAALCPAKTVQTFFVVCFEASVVLASHADALKGSSRAPS